jgi:hypothetical protein
MAKITIAQLQTSDSYINELTATELDATKGGILNNSFNGHDSDLVDIDKIDANVLSVDAENVLRNLDRIVL